MGERDVTMETVQGAREALPWKSRMGERTVTIDKAMGERGVTMDTVQWERGLLPWRQYKKRSITMETVQWGKVASPSIQQWWKGMLPRKQHSWGEGCYHGDITLGERGQYKREMYKTMGERGVVL
jgi:hypothetical protein